MSDTRHITRRSFLVASATGLSLARLASTQTPSAIGPETPPWLRAQFHLRDWADLDQRLPAILDGLHPFRPTRVSALGKYPDNFHLSIVGLNGNRERAELVLTSVDTQGTFGTVIYADRRAGIDAESLETHPRKESYRTAAYLLAATRESLQTGHAITLPEAP